jgi:50S ribosomal protein L16 3-hydroxylase
MVPVTMSSIVRFYNCNGRKNETRGYLLAAMKVLTFVILLTGKLTRFDDCRNASNDGRSCVLYVEAFSLLPLSSSPSTPLSTSSSISLRARSGTERIILDDRHSSANTTVHYSDLINIVSNAEYMDTETKKRFLKSLNAKLFDISENVDGRESPPAGVKGEKQCRNAIEANAASNHTETKRNKSGIPTIEGVWKDDGGPFHASGAWQTTPLLMKGAFVDEIQNPTRDDDDDDDYPFPSWKEIIELVCDGRMEHDDHNIHDKDSGEENFGDDESDKSEYDDGDGEEHQDEMWVGDGDDDEGYDDENEEFYLWGDEDQYHEEEDDSDNPPSRLIQYSWSRRDDSNYYHADVNTDWLDTFEINQFGPFNDPDSLEALLRMENEDNSDRCTARTLLVNDVDRWFPKLSDWMDHRFNNYKSKGSVLPARWRRDDAQISLSHPMGGIGPHVDDYDVFLIQLNGERTWDVLWEDNNCGEEEPGSGASGHDTSKISVRDETDCILPESSMNGVRILNVTKLQFLQKDRCGKTKTRLTRLHLRPGDCLYLPPRVLHCGTAVEASEDCITLSVGCRAPSVLELLDGLSDLMKKSATVATAQTIASAGSMFPSDAAVQAFHRRYTNAEIGRHENNNISYDSHVLREDDSASKLLPLYSQSSWLSPQVKNDMKNLVLKAVQIALDDDENILDPLVGRFVTKSNRLEEEEFGLGGGDGSSLSSFSYPKALGGNVHDERHCEGEGEDIAMDTWANATTTLTEFIGTTKLNEVSGDSYLRRAEGIAFAWSSVYDKELRIRKYRLYAQGRAPFEVFEVPHEGMDEEVDNPSEPFVSAPNSIVGQLMNRIANGPPLNKAFIVDELQILIDVKQKGTKYSITRLLYDLVEEGLLYGGYLKPQGS